MWPLLAFCVMNYKQQFRFPHNAAVLSRYNEQLDKWSIGIYIYIILFNTWRK